MGLVVEDVGLVVDVGAVGLGWDDGGSADMNKDKTYCTCGCNTSP